MKWPWVSRLAYERALAEAERLRAELQDARVGTVARQQFDLLQQQVNFLRHQNEQLINQLTRIKRKEVGLSEVPRPPRERPKPMPRELIDYCNKFASENVRRAEMEALERRHRDGESWDSIMADVFGSLAKGRDARQAAEVRRTRIVEVET